MTAARGRNLVKTLPGILISAFFLWYTFHKVNYQGLRSTRLVDRQWILVAIVFLVIGYTLRVHRWWLMLRASARPTFAVCGRVLMTSFAANNILPFRIGDIMRVFTYAGDLGAAPSAILSTVILERLLDVFTLLLLFVLTLGHGSTLIPHKYQVLSRVLLAAVSLGLVVLLLAAGRLIAPLRRLAGRLPQSPRLRKLAEQVFLSLDTIQQIGIPTRIALVGESFLVWACEGVIFVSIARLLAVAVGPIGPWQALAFSNLSYLIPSSPGAVGTFEFTAKTAMVAHGASETLAVAYALLVHAFILFTITAAGGVLFLLHRFSAVTRKPLLQEIETLPADLP